MEQWGAHEGFALEHTDHLGESTGYEQLQDVWDENCSLGILKRPPWSLCCWRPCWYPWSLLQPQDTLIPVVCAVTWNQRIFLGHERAHGCLWFMQSPETTWKLTIHAEADFFYCNISECSLTDENERHIWVLWQPLLSTSTHIRKTVWTGCRRRELLNWYRLAEV